MQETINSGWHLADGLQNYLPTFIRLPLKMYFEWQESAFNYCYSVIAIMITVNTMMITDTNMSLTLYVNHKQNDYIFVHAQPYNINVFVS